MTAPPRDPLLVITRAVLDADRLRLGTALRAEREAEARIATLDLRARASFETAAATPGFGASGSDLHWRGWLARERRGAIIQLAAARAQKAEMQRRLERSLGRATAAERIGATADRAQRAAFKARETRALEQLMVIAAARRSPPAD